MISSLEVHGSDKKLTTKSAVFDDCLLCAIDEALNALGESARQSVYFYMENKFKVSRDKIPEKLAEFQGGLEKIFGAGSQFIEIQIMKNLHSRIGRPLVANKIERLEFIEYLDAAKQNYIEKGRNHIPESKPYTISRFPVFTVSVAKL
jgi:hypothetical protein